MSIRCGHCHLRHESVVEVRTCANAHGRLAETPTAPLRGTSKSEPAVTEATAGSAGVPEGRYAIMMDEKLCFFKVDRPTSGRWANYVFVKQFASDIEHPVRGKRAERVLQGIVRDGIKEAMLRFGQETSRCGHCGRRLTDAESRARGIGPKCAGLIQFG